MFRNSWPRRSDRTARPSQHDRPCRRRRQSAHLSLERLETRTVPSFIPAVTFPVGVHPRAVTVADLNNDAAPDIAVVNMGQFATFESSLSVLLGNGDGSFQPAVTTDVLNPGVALSLAVGDFNGDGLPDVALTTGGSTTHPAVEVLLGNGDGSFQQDHLVLSVGQNPFSVAVGDFDGNGALDLVTANSVPGTLSLLLGNGDGSFQPRIDLVVGAAPRAVAVVDFNGDGLLDLVTAQQLSDTVSVLLGHGDGTFAPPQSFAASGDDFTPSSLAVGDVNGDGRADLVINSLFVLEGEGSQLGVLLGNGDGTFQDPILATPQTGQGDLALGDFDNDGLTDAAVTVSRLGAPPGEVALFFGNGDGTFQAPPQAFPTGGNDPSGVAAGDLNGDGLVDLAAANFFFSTVGRSTVGVLLNNTGQRPFGTLFTGEQAGVDLDVPFVLSSLGKQSPPPFDVNGGSIVNTNHGPFTLGTGRFTATFVGDGRVFHSGIPELYQFAEGGRNFWGVRGRGLGFIVFDDLPAAEVTVFARGTRDGLVSPRRQDVDGDGIPDFRGFGRLGNANAFLVAFTAAGDVLAVHALDNTAMGRFTIKGPVTFLALLNEGDANSFADIAGISAVADTRGLDPAGEPGRGATGVSADTVAVLLAKERRSPALAAVDELFAPATGP